jgi:Protein of unknown function (DUF669)
MTTLSFEAAAPALSDGLYRGKITKTNIMQTPFDGNVFYVVWDIAGRTIMDKFKLWADEDTKRVYAQDKFDKLCKAVGIASPKRKAVGETINFDTSALVGKEANVLVHLFQLENGNEHPYIQKYEAVTKEAPKDAFINDSIPY